MTGTSGRRITAVALRIFRQFVRDRRTMLLLFILPIFVMTLVWFLLEGEASKIPFALVKDAEGTSVVYDIISDNLMKESRIKLVRAAPGEVRRALLDGKIRGALIVRGGGIDDMMEGRGAALDLYLEGSDALATRDLMAILTRLRRNIMPAVRDVVGVVGGDADIAMASIELDTHYIYGGENFSVTDYFAPIILAVFPFVLTFLLTSVAFLRERSTGTVERLLVSPVSKMEVIAGYLLGFLFFTLIQAAIILGFVLIVLDVYRAGSIWLIFFLVALITVSASVLGMFLSSFARTELQVAQFMPLVILPLILVSGVLWPVETMPGWLKPLSYVSPLTWSIFGLKDVMIKGADITAIGLPVGMLVLFSAVFSALAVATLKRQLD